MNTIFLQSLALSVRSDGTYAPFSPEALGFAGEISLMGMGMIFAVLSILWGVLAIFKLVFVKEPKAAKRKEKEILTEAHSQAVAESVPEPEDGADDTALVAILTAAVAAYRASEEGTNDSFRVVSFRRAGKGSWNTGR